MKDSSFNIADEQLAAVRTDLHAIPDSPVGPHLAPGQFLRYAKGSLPKAETTALDRHLASCLACATSLERWIQAVELLTKLFIALHKKMDFSLALPAQAVAFKTREVDIATPDRLVGVHVAETESEDLEIWIGSRIMEYAGKTLKLRCGPLERNVVLTLVDDEQVGAKLVITKREREQLPLNVVPEVELVD